jgi:beta-galactosidase
MGRFSATVAEMYEPYIVPQECGNRTETRYVRLADSAGAGLLIAGDAPFDFSALPWAHWELEAADHAHRLPEPDKTVLRVSYRQMGVGGDRCWGTEPVPHPPYLNRADRGYRFCFTINMCKGER